MAKLSVILNRTYKGTWSFLMAVTASIVMTAACAQSSVSVSGYTKNLFSVIRIRNSESFVDNLLHNRINIAWFAHKNWTMKGAIRSRLFVGDQAGSPLFQETLERGANDYLDLSLTGRIGQNVLVHSYLDRLYLEYASNNWQVRIGRQRINWGIHTTWNPNDLFNAFAFTDFDYEERPGSDAISVQYYTGPVTSVEVVVRAFDRFDEAVIAGIWRVNKWKYDFQMLGGVFRNHLVLGGGWAGNLGNWGFKGEFSTFTPFEVSGNWSAAATMGWDYVFKDGIALSFSALYNSLGTTKGSLADLFSLELSARNLYPFRWSVLSSIGAQIHPLVYCNLATIYSPVPAHPLFVNPAITWSVASDFDLDVVAQFAFNKMDDDYVNPVRAFFVRAKWSY